MDIKLNQSNNKKSAWLCYGIAALIILLLSLGVVAGYSKFYEHSKSWYKDYDAIYMDNIVHEEDWLLSNLMAKNYTLGNQDALTSSWLFSGFNNYFYEEFVYGRKLYYIATDTETSAILEEEGSEYLPMGKDAIKITFSYDKKGALSISDFDGFHELSAENFIKRYSKNIKDIIAFLYEYSINNNEEYAYEPEKSWNGLQDYEKALQENVSLKNLEITYIVSPHNAFFFHNNSVQKGAWALEQSGILLLFAGFFLLAFLLGCFLPLKPLRFPAELSAEAGLIAAMFTLTESNITYLIYEILSGSAASYIMEEMHLANTSAHTVNFFLYGANVLLWFLAGAALFLFGHSLRLLFVLKPKQWFFTCTLIGRFLSFIVKGFRRLGRWLFSLLQSVDFSDSLDKKLLKLVGVQFLITGLLSLTWMFGTLGLLVYAVFLFFYLKKYILELKQKHQVLLSAANEMAEGNLNISITEDLGPFSSLGAAFTQIQTGFKKAVEEETKSQLMKTELITNVSHDLKTPLTAIITYVNLLKEENLTEEERQSYINTLDKKSLRLKQLIEDLFEVSKASSNNVTLHPVEVDLGALIKQASLELEEQIEASNIDFRYQLPEEKTILILDSEKTYRIIENLMVNIIKYALPGSRAYIELEKGEKNATLTMKNISAAELTFSTEEITDRFVRGDKSRSTEGSGLGLAIAKSFMELQGGSFFVSTDGDLFKVTAVFPVNSEKN